MPLLPAGRMAAPPWLAPRDVPFCIRLSPWPEELTDLGHSSSEPARTQINGKWDQLAGLELPATMAGLLLAQGSRETAALPRVVQTCPELHNAPRTSPPLQRHMSVARMQMSEQEADLISILEVEARQLMKRQQQRIYWKEGIAGPGAGSCCANRLLSDRQELTLCCQRSTFRLITHL